MIEQQATIIEVDGNTLWLQAERESTCSSCQVKQGCGTGLLAKHVGKKFSKISVHKTTDVALGKVVTLVIPEQALLQGATLMYMLPLTLLFLFSIICCIIVVVLYSVVESVLDVVYLIEAVLSFLFGRVDYTHPFLGEVDR